MHSLMNRPACRDQACSSLLTACAKPVCGATPFKEHERINENSSGWTRLCRAAFVLQFARSGVTVLGLDVDAAKVDALHQGRSYIKHIPSETVAEAVRAGTFSAATDFGRIREVDAVIICVPTPLNKNREPDISYIIDTGKSIARHLRKGNARGAGIHHLSRHDGRRPARGA